MMEDAAAMRSERMRGLAEDEAKAQSRLQEAVCAREQHRRDVEAACRYLQEGLVSLHRELLVLHEGVGQEGLLLQDARAEHREPKAHLR